MPKTVEELEKEMAQKEADIVKLQGTLAGTEAKLAEATAHGVTLEETNKTLTNDLATFRKAERDKVEADFHALQVKHPNNKVLKEMKIEGMPNKLVQDFTEAFAHAVEAEEKKGKKPPEAHASAIGAPSTPNTKEGETSNKKKTWLSQMAT